MYSRNLPGKANLSTTSFGISKREVFLLGGAIFIGLVLLAIPYGPIMVRVVISFLFMGALAIYTFYKVEKQWPIEVYLINKLKYKMRHRAYVKGGQSIVSKENQARSFEEKQKKAAQTYQPAGGYLLGMKPYSNFELVVSVSGVVFFAILLAWVGTGGVEEAQVQLRHFFGNSR